MYKFMFPLLVVLVVFALGFFTFDFGFDLVGDVPGVVSYADDDEFFYGYQTLSSSYSDAELSVVVNGAVGDVFVYKRAFYGVDEWTEFELESSTGVSQEGSWNASWVRGSAEAILDVPFAEYYVVAFVCRAYDPDNVTASYPMTSPQYTSFLSLFDDTAYVCGVAGFDGGALVHDKWHLDRVTCSDCVASCGSNNRTFSSAVSDWDGDFCSSGSPSPSNLVFPSEGSSVSWSCLGENGADVVCSARRESGPVAGVCGNSIVETGEECDDGNLVASDGCSPSCMDEVLPLLCDNSDGQLRPTHWTRELSGSYHGSHSTLTWNDFFQLDWPLGSAIDSHIRSDSYLALSFNSGSVGYSGAITFTDLVGSTVGVQESPALVSISRCQGDFREQEGIYENCLRSGVTAGNGFRWSLDPADSINKCVLEPNTDYYFNIVYVDVTDSELPSNYDPSLLSWTCNSIVNPDFDCGHRMQASASSTPECSAGSECSVDAVCGVNQDLYTVSDSDWNDPSFGFCEFGSLDGSSPGFPVQGTGISWSCLGENGGEDVACGASRETTVVPPPACANRVPPTLDIQQFECDARASPGFGPDCTDYSDVFGSPTNLFPGPSSGFQLDLYHNKYLAMEFTVPESSDSKGGWVFETGQYGATAWDDVLSSISKCPGDFDQAAITNEMVGNCMRASSGNSFSNGFVSWAIAGEGIDLDRCQLERGETYYLNFFLTDSLPGDPVENMEWVCSSPTLPNPSACGRAMAVSTNRDACQSSFDCQENHVCENGACKPILHPNSWTRETKPLATQPQQQIATWEQLFGQAFPKGNARDTRVGIDKYASISFNSGTLGTSGQLGFSDLGGNVVGVGMRPAIVSVSELPGDFRSQFGQYENCFKTGVGTQNPSFLWTRDPADTNFKCLLEPNKDYYLNIAYVSTATQEGLVSDFDWECTSFPTEYCGHRIHPIHSQ